MKFSDMKNLLSDGEAKFLMGENVFVFFSGPGGLSLGRETQDRGQETERQEQETERQRADTAGERATVVDAPAEGLLESVESGENLELGCFLDGLGLNDNELSRTTLDELRRGLGQNFREMFEGLSEDEQAGLIGRMNIDTLDDLVNIYAAFAKGVIERRRYADFFEKHNEENEDNPVDVSQVKYRVVLNARGMKKISIVEPAGLNEKHQEWLNGEQEQLREGIEDMVARFEQSRAGRFLLGLGIVNKDSLRGVLSGERFDFVAAIAAFIVLGRQGIGGIMGEILDELPGDIGETFDRVVDPIREQIESRGFLDRRVSKIATAEAFDEHVGNVLSSDLEVNTEIDLGDSRLLLEFASGDRRIEIPARSVLQVGNVGGELRGVEGNYELATRDDAGVRKLVLAGTIPSGTVFRGITKMERQSA